MSALKKISFFAFILILIGLIGTFVTARSLSFNEELIEIKETDENFTDIHITLDNGKVEILPSENSVTAVELYGRHVKKKVNAKLQVDTNDKTLHVLLQEKRMKLFQVFPETYALKVYVPKKEYESLLAESDNGKIFVSSIHSKTVHLRTDNGKIKIEHSEADHIEVRTKNGKINMNEVSANEMEVKTDNGKINLEDVEGDIYGHANNGKIILNINDLDRNIDIETDNGKLDVTVLHEPTNATIQSFVDNGKIDIFGDKSPNIVYGDGENDVRFTTSNGSIKVNKK